MDKNNNNNNNNNNDKNNKNNDKNSNKNNNNKNDRNNNKNDNKNNNKIIIKIAIKITKINLLQCLKHLAFLLIGGHYLNTIKIPLITCLLGQSDVKNHHPS